MLETAVSDKVTNESKESIIDESLDYDDNETTVSEELPTDDPNYVVGTESSTIGSSKESDTQNEKNNENLTFSIEGEKIVKAESNQAFTITVNTNQKINKFRLIFPSDASFFIEDTEKTKVQDLSDGSIIWLIDAHAAPSDIHIELTYKASGQFTIEDEIGGIHADFLHVEIDGSYLRDAQSRININVST